MKKAIVLFSLLLIMTSVKASVKEAILVKCIDGDTALFSIDGSTSEKYRFIAVDAPEVKDTDDNLGITSSSYVCKMLTDAKEILIEEDPIASSDKYGRKLGWIWADKKLVQNEIINMGYAKVEYVYDEYKYAKSLCLTEQKAISDKKGIWEKEDNIGYCSSIDLNEINSNIVYKNIGKIETEIDKKQKNNYERIKNVDEVVTKIDEFTDKNSDKIPMYIFYVIIAITIISLITKSLHNK